MTDKLNKGRAMLRKLMAALTSAAAFSCAGQAGAVENMAKLHGSLNDQWTTRFYAEIVYDTELGWRGEHRKLSRAKDRYGSMVLKKGR